MIPTKTYPLSAITSDQLTDKERIAELEAQVKHCEGHAAELEANVKALRVDAERLDLMAQQLFEHKWNGVIDSSSRTHWSLVGPYRHVVAKMEGKTFREAIDAALQPERRKGERRDPPYYGESARWLNPLAWERTGKDRRQAK